MSSETVSSKPEQLDSLRGVRATVVGLGREGIDLVHFLSSEGAQIRATDVRPASALRSALASLEGISLERSFGEHRLEDVAQADIVFVSPGVPPEIPILEEARRRGVRVSSATELFFHRCPGPIVGITGSSGKSTTTALTGAMLERSGRDVLVGGNIGVPMLHRLREITPRTWVVLELSSFQLEFLPVSPSIATITNLTPNHLDRHPSMEAYIAAKAQIIAHQRSTDWAILNADDPESAQLSPPGRRLSFSLIGPLEGAYLRHDGFLLVQRDGRLETICQADEVPLRGRHNLANVLAASATAVAAGVETGDISQAVRDIRALPHRIEPVATIDEVTYYNDSIATSPERSVAALLSFDEPIVLLAGGRDKHLPMDRWAQIICDCVRRLIVFGESAPLVRNAAIAAGYAPDRVAEVENLDDAVKASSECAEPGDVVLLSPGGTSYDAFHDFEERGERFAKLVRQLAGGQP